GDAANSWAFLKFDPYTELPGISADQIIEAWLVLYCENLAQFRTIPWNDPSNYDLNNSGSWSQDDWSGGPGQTNWSDPRRFSASENIDWENYPGEIRLAKQTPGAYYTSGELRSSIFDAGREVEWGYNKWIAEWGNKREYRERSDPTDIIIGVAISNNSTMAGAQWWRIYRGTRGFDVDNDGTIDRLTARGRYIQYMVRLTTTDTTKTPAFHMLWLLNTDEFYLSQIPINVEVRGVLSSWSESEITWNTKPAVGDPIVELRWPNDYSHVIKDNEAWYRWDITSWVKEKMKAGENISVCLKPRYEDSTIERYANFSSRESSGWKPPDENEFDQDDRGDKVTGHPPFTRPHLEVIYENGTAPGPSVYDNWGAYIDGGFIQFDPAYYSFPEHSFTLESGALVQTRGGYNPLFISDPALIVGEGSKDDQAITVSINRFRIVNSDRIEISSPVKLRVKVKENTDFRIEPTDTDGDGKIDPNRENVVVTIRTRFAWPWKYWLRDLTYKWNSSMNEGGLQWWAEHYATGLGTGIWSNNVVEFIAKMYAHPEDVRLYIWGRVEDPSVKDIYYYDRTYDVEVTIGV
ncbi:MAG: DNRLRE domain-containing protein, partial [Candidatus Hadarchaeales archaeon]